MSPTLVLLWKLAVNSGSRLGSNVHCPRNAMSSSGTEDVTAVSVAVVEEAVVDAFPSVVLVAGLERKRS